MIVAEGHGNTSQACPALSLGRSTYYRISQRSEASQQLEKAIIAKSNKDPRYGYRLVTVMVRRDVHMFNGKLAQPVRRV
jgi:hypothetical protein